MLGNYSKTKLQKMQEKRGYLGIDVSKGYADFILLNGAKDELGKRYKLYDNRKGHNALFKRLSQAKEEYGFTQIICGLESTGGYENNWYNSLSIEGSKQGLKVLRLNPRGVKHQGASDLTRTETDEVSARMIAHQLIANEATLLAAPTPSLKASQARRFYKYINTLLKQKTTQSNQLEKLVYSSFPELLTYAKNGIPKWGLCVLIKYPSHKSFLKARESSLLKINGLTIDKIKNLKKLAKESVGQIADNLLSRTISNLAKQIRELDRKIEEEKTFLSKNYTSEQVELLEGIKGIGIYSAIGIMMEIETVNRFPDAARMCSYFGVHPMFKKSGDGQTKPRMSKQGSASYRSILYMVARNVSVHNPYFKEIYAKFRAKGMNDGQAIGVIMNKVTRVIFGMLKSNKPFDPEVDKKNRKKTVMEQEKGLSKKQEEQVKEAIEEITNAPCSRRALKKKKAELLPQISIEEINARS